MSVRVLDSRILASGDGEPVALHDFGGTGPNLLFGHGNGLNAGMWAAVYPFLVDRFHCYGIDLRGHGACRPTSPDYSVDRYRIGQDVLACVDALGGEPVDYVGHSLGGAAAVFAALQRPEAFRALWLYEPVVIPKDWLNPDRPKPTMLVEAARRRRMEFGSVDEAVERLGSKPPFDRCRPEAVRAYLEIGTYPVDGGVRLSCEGENEARVFESGEALDFGRLADLTIPTVVAAGPASDDGHAIPAMVAEPLAAALGNARLERFDATHFGPMEIPEPVAASIVAHVDR